MNNIPTIIRLGIFPTLLSLPLGAATCDGLTFLKLPNTSITAAQIVAAGSFLPPGPVPGPEVLAVYKSLPAFCRVQGVIQPSSDSHIEFEVWLPASGWNGRYMGTGNGGFAGSVNYLDTLFSLLPPAANNVPSLADALLDGYAASSTDTGHKARGDDTRWALGHPEKIMDFGYRAIHETAEKSKMVIRAFYGDGPKYSYFSGESGGGRQALMEAQRFPADYDGIISGAPGISLTHLLAGLTVNAQATGADPASYIPVAKLPAIESAALAVCDALDGLKDDLIDDPRKCHFDPATLLCQEAESDRCLTQPQIAALRKIYTGARTSKGEQINPGYFPGGETGPVGWGLFIFGSGPGKGAEYALVTGGASLLFQNPGWDYRSFNLDNDIKIADAAVGRTLNATDPNLRAFKNRKGKLILFHGWSDPILPPTGTVDYFENVVAKMGRKDTEGFTRLYMVPGLQHGEGGPGPNNFRGPMTAALEHWVEQGVAPDKIIATRYKTDGERSSGVARTRPLCPYPQVARYRGSGNIDEAASFVCHVP
jgi:Tannase and feruloyl esterase